MAPHLILKKYFLRKQKINSSYSLRSFARDLKVNPAFISRILNGKQEIPLKRLKQMAEILDLDSVVVKDLKRAIANDFLNQLGLSNKDFSATAKSSLTHFEDRVPSAREMNVLNPWYNISIMELVTCEPFIYDKIWIAKRLGLTPGQVTNSLSYLLGNGYLKEENGSLRKTNKLVRLPTKKSHGVVRQFHKSMMEFAVKEMFQHTDDESFRSRVITSTSIAVNPNNVAKARERLTEMQLELAEILREGICTEVYDLTLALFPLTKR